MPIHYGGIIKGDPVGTHQKFQQNRLCCLRGEELQTHTAYLICQDRQLSIRAVAETAENDKLSV